MFTGPKDYQHVYICPSASVVTARDFCYLDEGTRFVDVKGLSVEVWFG